MHFPASDVTTLTVIKNPPLINIGTDKHSDTFL